MANPIKLLTITSFYDQNYKSEKYIIQVLLASIGNHKLSFP